MLSDAFDVNSWDGENTECECNKGPRGFLLQWSPPNSNLFSPVDHEYKLRIVQFIGNEKKPTFFYIGEIENIFGCSKNFAVSKQADQDFEICLVDCDRSESKTSVVFHFGENRKTLSTVR